MRALLLALAALTLTACNQVYSRAPLLGEAHEGGDPEFRPGLWLISGYEDRCAFDIRKPLRDWPDCAVGMEFRRGQMWFVSGHQRLLAMTLRMVDGPPDLVQMHWSTDVLKDPRAPEPKDTDNPFYGWTYGAVTVLKTDQTGQIMQAEIMTADCGPLDQRGPSLSHTNHPFAGLAMVGNNCVAKTLDTVRNALTESAKLRPPSQLRWVRDEP